jgi:hypothetical protein
MDMLLPLGDAWSAGTPDFDVKPDAPPGPPLAKRMLAGVAADDCYGKAAEL